MADMPTVQVQTQTRGAVPEGAVYHAVHRVRSLLRTAPEPVLFARVKLIMRADPAVRRPAIAQANVDLNGRVIHVQAAGETMRAAVAHACDRLRVRLERAARNWEAVRGGRPVAEPGEWRHQSLPTPRSPRLPRHHAAAPTGSCAARTGLNRRSWRCAGCSGRNRSCGRRRIMTGSGGFND